MDLAGREQGFKLNWNPDLTSESQFINTSLTNLTVMLKNFRERKLNNGTKDPLVLFL